MTAQKKRLFKILVIITTIALTIAAIIIGIHLNDEKLEEDQNLALQILEERKGDYDEHTIVLSDTSRSEAERFAKK